MSQPPCFFVIGDTVKLQDTVIERDLYHMGVRSPFTMSWLLNGEDKTIKSVKQDGDKVLCCLRTPDSDIVWLEDWMLERVIETS